MASVHKRGNRSWIRYRDAHRQWHSEPCAATSKTEAKELAIDVERRAERQRRGLEPIPPRDGRGQLGWSVSLVAGDLFPAPNVVRPGPVHRHEALPLRSNRPPQAGRDHARGDRALPAGQGQDARSADAEPPPPVRADCLQLRPASRALHGPNPAKEVLRRTVPKRKPDFLRVDEVPQVLAALATTTSADGRVAVTRPGTTIRSCGSAPTAA